MRTRTRKGIPSEQEFWSKVKVDLVPEISDERIEYMLTKLKPVLKIENRGETFEGFNLVDVSKIDPRRRSYIWDPPLAGKVDLYFGGLDSVEFISFHRYGAPSLFKPSLAESLANIDRFLPNWEEAGATHWWLNDEALDSKNVIGSFHWCRCKVWAYRPWVEE